MERVLLTGMPAPAAPTAPVSPEAPSGARRTRDVLRIRPDATVKHGSPVRVAGPFCSLAFRDLPGGVVAALDDLAAGHRCEADLMEQAIGDGPSAALRLHMVLRRLDTEGLLEHAVLDAAGVAVVRLRPVGRGATVIPPAPGPGTPVKLSRFAVARSEHGRLVVNAPACHLSVAVAPAAAAVLGALAAWTSAEAASADLDPDRWPTADVAALLRLFAAAGLLAPGDPEHDMEYQDRARAQWAAADLWLHARSRNPRSVAGYGGTYADAGGFEPLSATPAPRDTRTVELAVPDLDRIAGSEPGLTTVLERRRSVREHDDARPITVGHLGELLYRSVRIRGTFAGSDGQILIDRPVPSGGAVHELEVYPLVTRCAGLEAGLWHYRADRHVLEQVREPGPETEALVAAARAGAVMESDPQLTLIVTARFGRVMWKYETVAYPLILKHVGVLYQTLYLVGEAMGLAVCGLGGGDAADFAAAAGLDPLAEGSVGELVLGSRPAVLRHPLGVPRTPPEEGRQTP